MGECTCYEANGDKALWCTDEVKMSNKIETNGDLIKWLQSFPPDAPLYFDYTEENGNSFSTNVRTVTHCIANRRWPGIIVFNKKED